MPRYVVLLRGINVGGKHRLPMKDLTALLEGTGAQKVQTFIQSGNAVLSASAAIIKQIPDQLRAGIADRFGFDVPIVVRTAAQMQAVVAGNPFVPKADETALYAGFLADKPKPALVAALDPDRSVPDAFVVRGADVFFHLPGGVGKTKLTNAYFDRVLGTTITVRNWKTVHALARLVAA